MRFQQRKLSKMKVYKQSLFKCTMQFGVRIRVSRCTTKKYSISKLLRDNPDVATSSKMSLYGCFLDIAVNGLTLDQTGHPLCYILSRNCKTGYKNEHGNDIYENVHTFRLPATVNLPCVCVPAKLNMLTTPSSFMRETISRHL